MRTARYPLRRRGFTMVSALVALSVIGITAAVGMPAFWNIMNGIKLKQACRETLTAMRAARYRAINETREFGVLARYDNRIHIFEGTDPTDPAAVTQEIFLPGGIVVKNIDLFTTNVDGGFVIFGPDGSADEKGAVQFENTNQVLMEVRLDPAPTARMRLRTWDPIAAEWKEKG